MRLSLGCYLVRLNDTVGSASTSSCYSTLGHKFHYFGIHLNVPIDEPNVECYSYQKRIDFYTTPTNIYLLTAPYRFFLLDLPLSAGEHVGVSTARVQSTAHPPDSRGTRRPHVHDNGSRQQAVGQRQLHHYVTSLAKSEGVPVRWCGSAGRRRAPVQQSVAVN